METCVHLLKERPQHFTCLISGNICPPRPLLRGGFKSSSWKSLTSFLLGYVRVSHTSIISWSYTVMMDQLDRGNSVKRSISRSTVISPVFVQLWSFLKVGTHHKRDSTVVSSSSSTVRRVTVVITQHTFADRITEVWSCIAWLHRPGHQSSSVALPSNVNAVKLFKIIQTPCVNEILAHIYETVLFLTIHMWLLCDRFRALSSNMHLLDCLQ